MDVMLAVVVILNLVTMLIYTLCKDKMISKSELLTIQQIDFISISLTDGSLLNHRDQQMLDKFTPESWPLKDGSERQSGALKEQGRIGIKAISVFPLSLSWNGKSPMT
jgi:hypothetical protein